MTVGAGKSEACRAGGQAGNSLEAVFVLREVSVLLSSPFD